jgi:hypothetical protein
MKSGSGLNPSSKENPTPVGLVIELNKTDQLFSFRYSMNAEKANHQSQNLCTEA